MIQVRIVPAEYRVKGSSAMHALSSPDRQSTQFSLALTTSLAFTTSGHLKDGHSMVEICTLMAQICSSHPVHTSTPIHLLASSTDPWDFRQLGVSPTLLVYLQSHC